MTLKRRSRNSRRWGFAVLALVSVVGCRTGTLPDPNDPADGPLSPEILARRLRATSDVLLNRVAKREISSRQYRELLALEADRLVKASSLDTVDPSTAWQYADVMRTARHWSEAERILKVAVRWATESKNEDRRVNDTLRLAQAQAQQSKVGEAIATARTAFDTAPESSAPILPATLYEIVPPAIGKGQDVELGRLLEDAARIHSRTEVDPKSEAGSAFLAARPHHLFRAYRSAAELYSRAGREDLAQAAMRQASGIGLPGRTPGMPPGIDGRGGLGAPGTVRI